MATTHVIPMLDIYLGVDTGVNTTFGNRFNCFNCGDNNRAAAFHGGFGLNLLDGALTVAATTLSVRKTPMCPLLYLPASIPTRLYVISMM